MHYHVSQNKSFKSAVTNMLKVQKENVYMMNKKWEASA
jgi:hypothetical protein